MSLAVLNEQTLYDIGNAIREKSGTDTTYLPSEMPQAILDIPTGGSVDHGGKYHVVVFDYDGTVLKEDHLNTGATFELPAVPSHSRLFFQGWGGKDLPTITNNTITIENHNLLIGAHYSTVSGYSEFDISLTKATGLSITFQAMDGVKDWGDGTSDSATTHTYQDYGEYTIKCNSGTLTAIGTGSSSNPISYLVGVYLSNNVTTVSSPPFQYCTSLREISIPSGITTMNAANAFIHCYSLKAVVLPIGWSTSDMFPYCYSLQYVTWCGPNISNVFYRCYSLKECSDGIGSLSDNVSQCLTECYNIKKVVIKVTNSSFTFGTNFFSNCYNLDIIDLSQSTAIPALTTGVFGVTLSARKQTKIIVPDALYAQWVTATNWTAVADYIYKASEV